MISAQRPVACALTCAGVSFRSDASPLRLIGPTERDKPPSIGNTRTQRSKYDLRPTTGRVRFNMRRRFVQIGRLATPIDWPHGKRQTSIDRQHENSALEI